MSPMEIAFLVGVNEVSLQDDILTVGHPARQAYYRGVASTAHELRGNIRDAAMAGSPYSIAECQKLIMERLTDVIL